MVKDMMCRGDGGCVGHALVLLASVTCAITACGSGSLNPPGPDAGAAGSGGTTTAPGPTPRLPPSDVVPGTFDPAGRKIDVLFLIDNSPSMVAMQNRLMVGFPAFIDALGALAGGLPDLHIAVVTSDLGAGDGSISGCMQNGDAGSFRHAPMGPCTATTLAPGATFIAAGGAQNPQTNFTSPDITSVFSCIAAVGEHGCGFEHQLGAVARALGADGELAPVGNDGFLRPDAALAIVLVTNEDDCSAPVTSPLYDATQNISLNSAMGPPSNFRCNEFGHVCSLNGAAPAPPSRFSPGQDISATVTYSEPGGADSCAPAETEGALFPVADYVRNIKSLKADPARRIVVAALTGQTTPYVVGWKNPSTVDTGFWPAIGHSCGAPWDEGFADPAIRIQAFVRAFGTNGSVFSICDADYSPPLRGIATQIGHVIAP